MMRCPLVLVLTVFQTADEVRVQKALLQSACSMFKSVQGFMNDRAYSFPESLANESLQLTLATPLLRSV